MPIELPKNYDTRAVQDEIAAIWEAQGCFHAEPTDPGEPYSIVIPPPNVTAALHLGHALNNTIQDILIRKARMEGKNAVWLPGTDHAGIATQTVVEKRVLKEEGKRRVDFDRDVFVGKIQAWKDEYEQVILGQLRAMGCSCDFERTAFTMDPPRARAVREAFHRLFKDGLIYRGKRLVNWDPATQTALADDEVEMEEVDGFFYYLRYPVVADAQGTPLPADDPAPASITVATTRPETMLGDTAVALNPTDPRAEGLRGRFVRLPLVGRIIPIIEDDYVVKPLQYGGDPADAKAQMATGFLKVTPAHDPNDYEIGQRHNLAVINVMAPDGSISNQHGWTDVGEAAELIGKTREAAREHVVNWFRQRGLLEDAKPYRHSVGHSYRSHVPVEPYLSDQWYVAVQKPIHWMPDDGLVEGTTVPKNSLAGLALTALLQSRDRKGAPTDSILPVTPTPPSDDVPRPGHTQDSARRPRACFITFTTHGTRLHGSPDGSIDPQHNRFGEPIPLGNTAIEASSVRRMKGPPVELDSNARDAVQKAIVGVCAHRHWRLLALHVRTKHVHAVVDAGAEPKKVINDFKIYATRRLRTDGLVGAESKVWTRHGSARYVWQDASLSAVMEYVIDQQGVPLSPRPIVPGDAERADRAIVEHRRSAGDDVNGALPDGRGSVSGGSSDDTFTFVPDRYAKTFFDWNAGLRDWCISRQLWWGHRIPVWSDDGHFNMDGRGEQDPDVLDTWFSSALWPMSTLGWPERTPELETWNPTAVLCTAREIITLWVSRMVMFNRYLLAHPDEKQNAETRRRELATQGDSSSVPETDLEDERPVAPPNGRGPVKDDSVSKVAVSGQSAPGRPADGGAEVPFRSVYIHSMIQDGEGRKMSKSLGNGVDPLDIIATHGTDALRFTLASMCTQTQDVRMPVVRDEATGRNTSPKFDLGRGFCNKLWSIARFVLMSIDAIALEPPDESKWSLADRWIVTRLNRTIVDVNESLAAYRFDVYAKALFAFVEDDFSGWYVEFAKPQLRNDAGKGQTALLLASVLDVTLRLLHPAVPFVTEKLWEALDAVRPLRGVNRRIDCTIEMRLIQAAWPDAGSGFAGVEETFANIQTVVTAVRNLRNEQKVEPRRRITLSIKADAELAAEIDRLKPAIELLTTSDITVGPGVSVPEPCTRLLAGGCEIYAEGLVDESAEKERTAKRRAELLKQESALTGRMANAAYMAKAPPQLVKQTTDQLAAVREELAKLN